MKKKHKKVGLLCVILLVLLLLVAALDVRLNTVTYRIESEKVAAPVRIVQLSDLHSCAYGEDQSRLLAAVDALTPDAVVFTGDIVDDRLPTENAYLVFAALAEKYPCFYVTGNHEYWGGVVDGFCEEIAARGVTVLRGAGTKLTLNGQMVWLCGVDDPESGQTQAQLSRLAAQIDTDTVSILLSHRPELTEQYRTLPFDLVFAGHAHGGQWRIPGLLNGLLAPDQGFFPDYAGGLYDLDGRQLVVSRGLARESTRVPRVFNRPEIVAVDIVPVP